MKLSSSYPTRCSLIGLFVAIAGMIGAGSASAQSIEIPIIVKDTTSFYWQVVFAGGRKAGKELGVKIPELGAQSESDINGQISIFENLIRNTVVSTVRMLKPACVSCLTPWRRNKSTVSCFKGFRK
jgi:ribose transport system substrate-binding protein